MAQLTCRDLTLGYEGNPVIEHLSFSVNAGDYLYIVGENGSGKSTLMKALLRLKSPMAGTIETGDGLQADEIGYLPQQTAVQRDFPASVQEIVRSGCLNRCGFRPFYNRAEKQLAQKNMERLDISPSGAIGSCPADSSSVSFWHVPSVPPRRCCCWMNR